ncbi:MAG: penicillin-binding protein 2 [Armatimonadetes bacterium]|nr:penicillin-binding protein 2 [Armatimonadota bacterium]
MPPVTISSANRRLWRALVKGQASSLPNGGAKSSGENLTSRHRAFVRDRTTFLFLAFALAFVVIVGQLVHVQVIDRNFYRAKAARIRYGTLTISASRGAIYDRNGRVLAMTIDTISVFANTREIKDMSGTALKVAQALGMKADEIEHQLRTHDGYLLLAKNVEPSVGDQLRKLRAGMPGVGCEQGTMRVYPLGSLAAQIVGFTNIDNKGIEGIESVFDDKLTGKPGQFRAELDSARRVISWTKRTIKDSEDGKNVYLTIDVTIQHITEQALAKMAKKYSPKGAYAIVTDPNTGEILALANYPTYDPNKPRAVQPDLWRNKAVSDLYEPGSTLKVVTIAAGLNEGFSPHVPMAYCTGKEKMKGGRIPCVLHKPFLSGHGRADMYRIIEYSCNIGAAHVAMKLGADRLKRYEKAFGLMERCRAGFGCEAPGYPISEREWRRPIKVANVGFGQGIAVTPLQMAVVYATIANGGVRVQPKILHDIRDPDGTVSEPFKVGASRRVISKNAAVEMTKMLSMCVDIGTGKPAQIDGRTVAGKTGSAQIARLDGDGYEKEAYIASFMGFAPVSKPRLVITVVVDRPKNSHWGATVAAPVFQEIGEKSLWYLKVPSDAPMKKDIKSKPGVKPKTVA